MYGHALVAMSSATPSATNPLQSRFGWIELHARTVHDDEVAGEVACVLLTPSGQPGCLAEQAIRRFAEEFGVDPRRGSHVCLPDGVHVTLAGDRYTLHVRGELTFPRPAPPDWHQIARSRGWVRVVIGYQAMAADTDVATYLDDALAGRGVTADVPVR